MLIPAIDLMNGRIVQLEQGERLVLETPDIDAWVDRFASYPLVQVIDLDAAMGRGSNTALVSDLCGRLPCQVGGGVRTPDRARALLDAGARRVIAGSALFGSDGVDIAAASQFAEAVLPDRFVAAVDTRGGCVVTHGWKRPISLTPTEAMRALGPFVTAFLYTQVDDEGMLGGIDMKKVLAVAGSTSRRVIAAGGIRSQKEVDDLDQLGIDAVVGMAIYRGLIAGP